MVRATCNRQLRADQGHERLMTHHKGSLRLGGRGLGQWRKLRILDLISREPLSLGSCITRPHTIGAQRDLSISRPIPYDSIRVCDEAGTPSLAAGGKAERNE